MQIRKVNAALKEQVDKLWHTTCIYVTEPMQRYAEKLIKTLPDGLDVRQSIDISIKINQFTERVLCEQRIGGERPRFVDGADVYGQIRCSHDASWISRSYAGVAG